MFLLALRCSCCCRSLGRKLEKSQWPQYSKHAPFGYSEHVRNKGTWANGILFLCVQSFLFSDHQRHKNSPTQNEYAHNMISKTDFSVEFFPFSRSATQPRMCRARSFYFRSFLSLPFDFSVQIRLYEIRLHWLDVMLSASIFLIFYLSFYCCCYWHHHCCCCCSVFFCRVFFFHFIFFLVLFVLVRNFDDVNSGRTVPCVWFTLNGVLKCFYPVFFAVCQWDEKICVWFLFVIGLIFFSNLFFYLIFFLVRRSILWPLSSLERKQNAIIHGRYCRLLTTTITAKWEKSENPIIFFNRIFFVFFCLLAARR